MRLSQKLHWLIVFQFSAEVAVVFGFGLFGWGVSFWVIFECVKWIFMDAQFYAVCRGSSIQGPASDHCVMRTVRFGDRLYQYEFAHRPAYRLAYWDFAAHRVAQQRDMRHVRPRIDGKTGGLQGGMRRAGRGGGRRRRRARARPAGAGGAPGAGRGGGRGGGGGRDGGG